MVFYRVHSKYGDMRELVNMDRELLEKELRELDETPISEDGASSTKISVRLAAYAVICTAYRWSHMPGNYYCYLLFALRRKTSY